MSKPSARAAVGEDPFEAVMGYSGGVFARLRKADRFFDNMLKSVAYNTLFTAYFVYAVAVILLLAAPFLIKSDAAVSRGAGALAYNLGYISCHQLPHRSIFVNGIQLPVCARCTGFFVGLLLGVAYSVWGRRVWAPLTSIKGLVISVAPLAVDGLAQTIFVLWESANSIRFVSGLFLGFGGSVYILHKIFSRKREIRAHLRKHDNTLVSFFTALLLYAILVNPAAAAVGERYVTNDGAVSIAAGVERATIAGAETYFIPPRTPLSLAFDPYLEKHRGNIVSDLLSDDIGFMGVGEPQPQTQIDLEELNSMMNDNPVGPLALLPATGRELAGMINPLQNYGIWVVVAPDGGSRRGEGAYTKTSGRYVYVDAWTGRILFETRH